MTNLANFRQTGPLLIAVVLFCCCPSSFAQIELVRRDFFPAELEFKELGEIRADRVLEDSAAITGIPEGGIFLEAGCRRLAQRDYEVKGGGTLSIEVADFKDGKGAYSLLTLLRAGAIHDGPPGQYYDASDPGEFTFVRGNYWVRLKGAEPDLLKRVATSVSNRIGARDSSLPALVKRIPAAGYLPGSLRYFLGPLSFRRFGGPVRGWTFSPSRDLELAEARYETEGQSGLLFLMSFATGQLAEEYFDGLRGADDRPKADGFRTYARRVGPLVGILEGTFQPEQADKILGSLEFQYSIRWIYDKNNRSSATVWGVPVGLLGTVVRSLVLVALLCLASMVVGFAMAAFRIFLRGYAPNNFLDRPERTEMIRLKLDEN